MINDHTDAEAARREHAYEMGEPSADEQMWEHWSNRVERMLICSEVTTEQQGLDGDQFDDCFSLDGAHDAYMRKVDPVTYFEHVMAHRKERGLAL